MIYDRPWEQGVLRTAENGRSFLIGDRPFFWMADTAWLLFHKLSFEEAAAYLRNRKEMGYNVILADFIHSADQADIRQEKALRNENPAEPDENSGFWQHADAVMDEAERLGLYMGILPVWGSSIVAGGCLNENNAEAYMQFILRRYHDRPNLIWIVGGDVRGDVNRELFCRMGNMMKQDRPDRLVGYHPFGRTTSAFWFNDEPWLDFNMFQSGHRRYDQKNLGVWDDNNEKEGWFGEDNWRYVQRDLARIPKKPVFDGEPSYEEIPQGLHDPSQPYWKAADVRRYAYWSVFAGAAGHTYGHNSVMQFYSDRSEPGAFGVKHLWKDAVHHPGAAQMIHLKKLMESVDFASGRAYQECLACPEGEKYERISVFAGKGFLFAYTYTGREIRLDTERLNEEFTSAYWMDPVTGARTFIREIRGEKNLTFIPPEREDSKDAVLILL